MVVMADLLPTLESWNCFACGPSHPKGLRLSFEADGDVVRTKFSLGDDYTGTGPVLHGGIVATVFDETMAWTLLRFQRELYFTTKLEIRYRKPVERDLPVLCESHIDRVRGRGLAELSARLFAEEEPDTTLADATAVFVKAPADVMETVPAGQRLEMERILASFTD